MKTWTKEEQEAAFDRWAVTADWYLFDWLHDLWEERERESENQRYDSRDDFIALSRSRAFSIGYDEYGDAAFHQSKEELEREKMEELADIHFRFVVELATEEEE